MALTSYPIRDSLFLLAKSFLFFSLNAIPYCEVCVCNIASNRLSWQNLQAFGTFEEH